MTPGDPNASVPAWPVDDDDLADLRAALEAGVVSGGPVPRGTRPPPTDAARMASLLAFIVLGRSRAEAGIEDGTPEAALWDRLAADVARIRQRGGEIEVPPEWF